MKFSKNILSVLLIFTFLGSNLHSGLLHVCLESIEIGLSNDSDHCVTASTDCCGNVIQEEEDCDDCFDIDVDNKIDLTTLNSNNKVDIDHYLFDLPSYNDDQIINIYNIELDILANPPPGLHDLATYLSKSFLRGPTSYLV